MAKYASKGLSLQLEIATVLTTITQLTGITFPDGTVETYKDSSLDTAGPSHTYNVTGWVDEGDLTATGFYDPSEVSHGALEELRALKGLVDNPTNNDIMKKNWRIVLPTLMGGLFWAFQAILTKATPKGGLEEALMIDIAAKVSGNITYPAPA